MMWIPHMSSFVKVNHNEIKTMVYRLCKTMYLDEEKDTVLHYVLRYFVLSKIKYKKDYVGQKGLSSKLSTYIYKCVVFIIMKYKDKEKCDLPKRMIENKFERYPLNNEIVYEPFKKDEAVLYMNKFISFIKKKIQENLVPEKALIIIGLFLKGYSLKDASTELKVSHMRGSQIRSILREQFAIFKQKDELCAI
jgi:hypothetical protein